jgi:hypothetical protein
MLPRARVFWPALIGSLALLDWLCSRGEPDGDTVSELIRETFATDTPAGRYAFTGTIAAGAYWLHRHILG